MYLRLPTSLIQNGIILFVLHNKSTILIWSEELLSHWSFGLSNRHSLRCTWMPFAPRPRARSLPAVFLSYNVSMFMLGATHKLRQLNFQNSWPPSPPCQHCGPFYCIKITQPPLLLRIWVTSPPSLPLLTSFVIGPFLTQLTEPIYLARNCHTEGPIMPSEVLISSSKYIQKIIHHKVPGNPSRHIRG